MNALEMQDDVAARMAVNEKKAVDILGAALDGAEVMGEKVALAMRVLQVTAKNRQTLTAREGVRYSMVRDTHTDDEVRAYVEATRPEVKKLTGSETKRDRQ